MAACPPQAIRQLCRRRTVLKATGTGTLGSVLAGCAGINEGNTEDGTNGDTVTESQTDKTGTTNLPETITLGAFGPADVVGSSILNSAELAVEELNDTGGIGGADVELLTRNTEKSPGTDRELYTELVAEEAVDATLGGYVQFNRAKLRTVLNTETIHLNTGGVIPEAANLLTDSYEGRKNWFRIGPIHQVYRAESLARFAADRSESMGWERVAVITPTTNELDPYHDRLVDRLRDVVEVSFVGRGSVADYRSLFNQIEAEECDLVLSSLPTNAVVTGWRNRKQPFDLVTPFLANGPSSFESKGGAPEGSLAHAMATATAEITAKTVPYAEAYQAAYGSRPNPLGYSAYDAVYTLASAIEQSGSVAPDDLVEALEAVSYTGTTGTIEFLGSDEEFPHEVRYGPEYVQGVCFQWQTDDDGTGRQRTIWPDTVKEATYQPPPWLD